MGSNPNPRNRLQNSQYGIAFCHKPHANDALHMADYSKLTEQERAEIGALSKLSPNIAALARKYQCTRAVVKHWLDEGLKARPKYSNRPGQGRPRHLTATQEAKIRQRIVNKRCIRVVHSRLRPASGRKPSVRTLARVVKRGRVDLGWKPLVRGKRLSADTIAARLRFCRENPSLPPKKGVFLDAKYLYMYNDNTPNQRYCWQRLDHDPVRLPPGSPTVYLFYAAVAHGHKSKLYFVPPTPPVGSNKHRDATNFVSEDFVRVMRELKLEMDSWYPAGDYYIIRDHAKQHLSKYTTKELQGLKLPWKVDYPAKSWDLNVIEVAWGLLDEKLQGMKGKCNQQWRGNIEKAWDKVSQASINKLVASLPDRMQQVIEREGKWPSSKA